MEGKRPKRLCQACRTRLQQTAHAALKLGAAADAPPPPICFQCYREELKRQTALKAAGELDTASEQRFQSALPFEPVDQPRLAALKAGRAIVRMASQSSDGRFVDRRRQAQIAARHALQTIDAGLRQQTSRVAHDRVFAAAVHAAELQLPESWLPFVCAR